jgi:broad specificity phosphatase PhoE
MIILVRHAQSEGNKNRDIHQFIPDHRVKLTQNGWGQVRRLPSLPAHTANTA